MPTPQYIELDNMGLCGIAGISGSGKSSTIRLLAAQLALMGAGLLIVDGHGRYAEQTLAATLAPLAKSFIRPIAIEDTDIIAAFDYIDSIAQNRLSGKDTSKQAYVLIADEIVSILSRIEPAQAARIISILIKFATDYRKTHVKVIIAAQNWTKDFIGSAAIRRSMNITLLHRMAPDVVGLFSNNPIVKRGAPNLQVGQLFILSQTLDPVKVRVPNIFQDDLIQVSNTLSSPPMPYEISNNVSSVVSPPQSSISHFIDNANTALTVQKWYEEIRKYVETDKTKTEIIKLVFDVSPGSSKRYKMASRVYDWAVDKYYAET